MRGCTRYTSQVGELSYLHDRDVTYAVLCQGPYEESARHRDFMGWTMPWYPAQESLEKLLGGVGSAGEQRRRIGRARWRGGAALSCLLESHLTIPLAGSVTRHHDLLS